MLVDAALGCVNHLLAGEDWARKRLKGFAGQTACLELGKLRQPLEITLDGYFKEGNESATTSVVITLPADAPIRALTDRPSLFSVARISGSAELAECLGFIFRNLHWDAESDLSLLVGDIAAHRLVEGGRRLARWQQQQAKNMALNLAEFFTEESPIIARHQDVSAFCSEVGCLQDWLDQLEKRVASLESRSPQDPSIGNLPST